ncbi:MAG: sigma-54-dependent Fis family transcriptional regulator, partial [Desulfobacteraceae bacterium]|nr:sigma-54-dependent Fis family transcriptional regulator [Desulfobacteraceae bacterium]
LKKALIFNRGTPIQPEEITMLELDQNISANEKDGTALSEIQKWIRTCLRSETKENIFDSCIDHVASLLVKEALNSTQGNRSQAAKLLGMSRPTFHSKIEKYDIKIGTAAKK